MAGTQMPGRTAHRDTAQSTNIWNPNSRTSRRGGLSAFFSCSLSPVLMRLIRISPLACRGTALTWKASSSSCDASAEGWTASPATSCTCPSDSSASTGADGPGAPRSGFDFCPLALRPGGLNPRAVLPASLTAAFTMARRAQFSQATEFGGCWM